MSAASQKRRSIKKLQPLFKRKRKKCLHAYQFRFGSNLTVRRKFQKKLRIRFHSNQNQLSIDDGRFCTLFTRHKPRSLHSSEKI